MHFCTHPSMPPRHRRGRGVRRMEQQSSSSSSSSSSPRGDARGAVAGAVRKASTTSSSSSSSSSNGSGSGGDVKDDGGEDEEDDSDSASSVDEKELERQDKEAEKRHRNRRYALEDAREGGDEEDGISDCEDGSGGDSVISDNEDEDEDENETGSQGSQRGAVAGDDAVNRHSRVLPGNEQTLEAKKKKKKKKKCREDFSLDSGFANMRAMENEVYEEEEEEGQEEGKALWDNDSGTSTSGSENALSTTGMDCFDKEDEEEDGGCGDFNNPSSQLPELGGEDDEREAGEDDASIMRKQMYYDPDCNNNVARSMRIVSMEDVKIDPNVDGYVYCFTSVADGPVLSQMALKQILVLLHIIFSYVPEECIVETEYLKPTFDRSIPNGGGGLEKLQKKVPMSMEDLANAQEVRQKLSSMPLCDMPFNTAFVAPGGSTESGEDLFTLQIVDVADILVVPVCITHSTASAKQRTDGGSGTKRRKVHPQQNHRGLREKSGLGPSKTAHDVFGCGTDMEDEDDDENNEENADGGVDDEEDSADEGSREKITGFWMVMLKTRKCYNFQAHLHWLVNSVDKKVCLIF